MLAYADDVELLAKEEDELRVMIRMLQSYISGKGSELNTRKTKIMRCRKDRKDIEQ